MVVSDSARSTMRHPYTLLSASLRLSSHLSVTTLRSPQSGQDSSRGVEWMHRGQRKSAEKLEEGSDRRELLPREDEELEFGAHGRINREPEATTCTYVKIVRYQPFLLQIQLSPNSDQHR